MKKPYNGHESWNAWNVSLWIGNDEGLYMAALDALKRAIGAKHRAARAARLLMADLPARTPDGARYSHHSVMLALSGLS